MKSFTEKKLSALMLAICIIYGIIFPNDLICIVTFPRNLFAFQLKFIFFVLAIGNLPQMAVMILQNEGMNNSYKFQVT